MISDNILESDYSEQFGEASDCVSSNNKEVMKQGIILIRLLKYIDSDGGFQDSYGELVDRITQKLDTHMGIWELYLRKDKEELISTSLELEKALESKEMLRVRKEVGDIGDEEYRLKMAVADWGAENYRKKTHDLETSVKIMSSLGDRFESEFIDEIHRLAHDDYQKIRDIGLNPETSKTVIRTLSKISEILN